MIGGIYKKGQGYWTRTMSAIAYGTLLAMGLNWLWKLLTGVRVAGIETVYVQAGTCVLVVAVLGYVGYYLIGLRRRVVDFMIATEGEMKKVNWSSWREIRGSTAVVIGLTIFIGAICFGFDSFFQLVFKSLGVLEQ
jgi:preprotein translocase SecE subunit